MSGWRWWWLRPEGGLGEKEMGLGSMLRCSQENLPVDSTGNRKEKEKTRVTPRFFGQSNSGIGGSLTEIPRQIPKSLKIFW